MEKDKLIEEMLKDMGDRNNTIDLNAYGRGLIDMYDRLIKNCSTPNIVGRGEQLGCKFCGADKGLKHGYMPDGEPCPMDLTV